MKNEGKRVVVCAANRWEHGVIIPSARHFDLTMHAVCQLVFGKRSYAACEQGFIDQWGVFMTREEAFLVASEAGQLAGREKVGPAGTLFSEDLY